MIKEYFRMMLRNFHKRKLRSALTLLGIVIAITTLVVLIALSLGLQSAVQEQFRLLGTDKLFIFPRGQVGGPGSTSPVQLSEIDVDTIDRIVGVRDLSYAVVGNAEVKFREQRRYVPVIGIPLDRSAVMEETGAYKAEEGRLLEEHDSNEVMIGSQYKHNNLFVRPVSAGDKLVINGQEFRVKGILKPIGNPGDDRLVYMPLEDFRQLFSSGNRVDQIIVQVDNEEDIHNIADRIAKKLRTARGLTESTQDFSIITPEELIASFEMILTILTGFLVSIASISLLVGSIGIATTMYTSVLERTREIGVMKAVGARNSDVLFLFVGEAALLGFIGGVAGSLLGLVVSELLEYLAGNYLGTSIVQATIPPALLVASALFAALVGAIAGLIPARQASKIQPVTALRYE